jgi:rubrerythrin
LSRRKMMMKLDSLDEILRFAIRKEADAAAFYKMAADRSNPGVKKTFKELAKMEEGHKKKLEGFDLKKIGKMQLKETKGLGMSEIMEDVPYSSDMSYADLLRMAIKNEEKSQQLYLTTGKRVTEPNLKKLLLILAQEESTHKEKLEKIYDEEVLTEF